MIATFRFKRTSLLAVIARGKLAYQNLALQNAAAVSLNQKSQPLRSPAGR